MHCLVRLHDPKRKVFTTESAVNVKIPRGENPAVRRCGLYQAAVVIDHEVCLLTA